MKPKISFIIPTKDEQDNIAPLYKAIVLAVKKISERYEIIFIDDGSTDQTFSEIKKVRSKNRKVKLIKLRGNWGKSIALQSGFNIAKGEIIFTLDGDLQDNPSEIPKFIKKINSGYDLVSGWKKTRHDPLSKVIPSRILNNILIPFLTGVKIHDTNCGFKAYRSQVIKNITLYGELYRFIPILAAKQNFRIAEIEVKHQPRIHGKSKFGWQRNFKGLLDLMTVAFLTGYLRRPSHFFGTLGIISFGLGFMIGLYITYLRVTTGSIQFRHPLLFLGMLLIIVGVQLFTMGLVAEMITNFNQRRGKTEKYIAEKLY